MMIVQLGCEMPVEAGRPSRSAGMRLSSWLAVSCPSRRGAAGVRDPVSGRRRRRSASACHCSHQCSTVALEIAILALVIFRLPGAT